MAANGHFAEDWRATLDEVVEREFCTDVLREHLIAIRGLGATLEPDEDLETFDALAVGECGEGLLGTYVRAGGVFRCEKHHASIVYCKRLWLWALTVDDRKKLGGVGSTELLITRSLYGLQTTDVDGPQLLYVCLGRAPTERWISALGAEPAPIVARPLVEGPLPTAIVPTPLCLSGKGSTFITLPSTTTTSILSALLDLRSARWRLSEFMCNDIPCGATTVELARRIAGLRADARLACVCKSWRAVVAEHKLSWTPALRHLLQLHGDHGQNVASMRGVVELFRLPLWENMHTVIRQPEFQACAWPVRVTSVQILASEPFGSLRRMCKPFAAFAQKLLCDQRLPWIKCRRGAAQSPDKVHCQEGLRSVNGGPASSTCDFIKMTFHTGEQLFNATDLLVSPAAGLLTRRGARIRDRLTEAYQELQASHETSCLFVRAMTKSWNSTVRRPSLCRLCQEFPTKGFRCIRCRDKRTWSCLNFVLAFEFERFPLVEGRASTISFEIAARVLPFVSTSDDAPLLRELACLLNNTPIPPKAKTKAKRTTAVSKAKAMPKTVSTAASKAKAKATAKPAVKAKANAKAKAKSKAKAKVKAKAKAKARTNATATTKAKMRKTARAQTKMSMKENANQHTSAKKTKTKTKRNASWSSKPPAKRRRQRLRATRQRKPKRSVSLR